MSAAFRTRGLLSLPLAATWLALTVPAALGQAVPESKSSITIIRVLYAAEQLPETQPPSAGGSLGPAATQTPATSPAAQAATNANPGADAAGGGPSVLYGRVGYIDSAIPTSQFRLRFDASYNDTRPSRAEFIYARDALTRKGPFPAPEERRIDFQEFSAYLEVAFGPRCSVFLESPYRLINPELNPDHDGFSDLNAGFKYAFLRDDDRVATFQLRTYAPTGDSRNGLGNGHATLEPALLLYRRLTDRLAFEGELRYWAPIGGTDFAGDIIRYGLGLDYELARIGRVKVSPVLEVVGWTVLGGKEDVVVSEAEGTEKSAAGDTIVNAKLGLRFKLGELGDFYTGYGRALTGTRWYEDMLRVEFRMFF